MGRRNRCFVVGVMLVVLAGIVLFMPLKGGSLAKTLLARIGSGGMERIQAVQSLVDDGKAKLYAHDILGAQAKFAEAVGLDPTNQEAQFLYGVTRVLAVYEEGQTKHTTGLDSIREIAELMGFQFTAYGLYKTEGEGPEWLALSTPKTGEMLAFLRDTLLAEVDGALANLAAVTNPAFASLLNPSALDTTGPSLNVDYGDVLIIRSALYAVKASLELFLAYDLDVYPPQIVNGNMDDLATLMNILKYNDKLGTPKEPSRLTAAKAAFVSCVDTYNLAVAAIQGRGQKTNHLFVLDVPLEELTNEPFSVLSTDTAKFQNSLAEIKASLSGVNEWTATFPDAPANRRTFDLSMFFDPLYPLDLRQRFIDANGGLYISDATAGGILPYGIGAFETPGTPELHRSEQAAYYTGLTVALQGSHFTPNGNVRLYIRKPDNTSILIQDLVADAVGRFQYPYRIPVDAAEGVYALWAADISSAINSNEETFPVTGHKFSLAWGSAGSGAGQFFGPQGVATDSTGNVYVADSGNNRVQKFNASGAFLSQWNVCCQPSDIALDGSGNTYVTTPGYLFKYSSAGSFLKQWGAYGTNQSFNQASGITVDKGNNVYVAERGNRRIQKFSSEGVFIGEVGSPVAGATFYPLGLAVDGDGNILAADPGYSRIVKFSSSGTLLGQWGQQGDGYGNFLYPVGIGVASPSGNIYVTDAFRVQKFNSSGQFTTAWGKPGGKDGEFSWPAGIAVGKQGSIFVADTYENRIEKFVPVVWHSLTVTTTGLGSGTVVSIPTGLSCHPYCKEAFTADSVVDLVALPKAGSTFTGWTGCDTVSTNTCEVSLASDRTVGAAFAVCTYAVSPGSKSMSAKGGSVTATVSATGGTNCAQPSVGTGEGGWITNLSLTNWKKNRGTLKFTVAANNTSVDRQGSVDISGTALAVTQKGLACKIVSLTPATQSFTNAGGSGTTTLEVDPNDCIWTASTSSPFLHTTSQGTGDGEVAFTVDANPPGGKARTGKVDVVLSQNHKKKSVTVKQAK